MAFLGLAQYVRQNSYNSATRKVTHSSTKIKATLPSQKNNKVELEENRQKSTPKRTIATGIATEVDLKKCSIQKIILENKKIYRDTTIGNDNLCEVILPSLSYIKIIGNVKIIAHKVSLLGVINGNANESGNQNAANLEIIAYKEIETTGSIELRGLSDNKFPISKGGLLKVTAPKTFVSALINLQGSRNEYNGSSSFTCNGSDCSIHSHNILYSKNEASSIPLSKHAEEIIQLVENIKSLKAKIASLKSAQVSETLNFSLLQKVKLLKQRRDLLNSQLELSLNKEIESEAIKNGTNFNSFMSSGYGAKYFQKKAFSYNSDESSRAETLLKDLELQVVSQLLKKNKNFNLYSWGLEADASFQLEEKIHEIQSKALEVYGT